MTKHEPTEFTDDGSTASVTCACGRVFQNQTMWKARDQHDAHRHIEQARAALEGDDSGA